MKKFIITYWLLFPVLLALSLVLYCFAPTLPVAGPIVGWLTDLAAIAIIGSWVILLFNKQWKRSLYSFLLTVTICLALSNRIALAPVPDDFGKKHIIPEGLEYSIPSEEYIVVDTLDKNTYFQIWNAFQGGNYAYDFYYGPLPAGEVFLRCFEATKNIKLSAGGFLLKDRMYESSKVSIDSTSRFSKLVDRQGFTIYEGDWGDYYAARIEVWHKDAQTGQETKLMEKVYRVEGWMR
jgi:hypothetical protein